MADYITGYSDLPLQPAPRPTVQVNVLRPGGAAAPAPAVPMLLPQQTNASDTGYLVGNNLDTAWVISTRYVWRFGILATPLMAYPPAPSVFVAVHAPQCYRIVAWAAETAGQWPLCPSFVTGDPNEVLLHKTMLPQSPRPLAGGQRAYRVTGLYVYGLQLPLSDTATLVAGTVAPDAVASGLAPPLNPATFLALLPPSQGQTSTLTAWPTLGGTSTLTAGTSPFPSSGPGQNG